MLPTWVGRTAYVLALINLAFVPALYFGDNAADFYSAQGWGHHRQHGRAMEHLDTCREHQHRAQRGTTQGGEYDSGRASVCRHQPPLTTDEPAAERR
jgi:hypothetical protein